MYSSPIQVLEQLNSAGVGPGDPHFDQLVRLLHVQNKLTPPAPPPSQQPPTGLAPPSAPSSAPMDTSAASQLPIQPVTPGNASSGTAAGPAAGNAPGPAATASTTFSAAHVLQLKAQLLAFRQLSRSVPLTPNVLNVMRAYTPMV